MGILSQLTFQFRSSLIVLEFNDTSTLVGHFVSSPRERENRDRKDSKEMKEWDRGEGEKWMKVKNKNRRSANIPLYPHLLH